MNGDCLHHLSSKWSCRYSYYFNQTLAVGQLFTASVRNSGCQGFGRCYNFPQACFQVVWDIKTQKRHWACDWLGTFRGLFPCPLPPYSLPICPSSPLPSHFFSPFSPPLSSLLFLSQNYTSILGEKLLLPPGDLEWREVGVEIECAKDTRQEPLQTRPEVSPESLVESQGGRDTKRNSRTQKRDAPKDMQH